MGGDEFALTNEYPPIKVLRDTENKLFNKELESSANSSLPSNYPTVPKISCPISFEYSKIRKKELFYCSISHIICHT